MSAVLMGLSVGRGCVEGGVLGGYGEGSRRGWIVFFFFNFGKGVWLVLWMGRCVEWVCEVYEVGFQGWFLGGKGGAKFCRLVLGSFLSW